MVWYGMVNVNLYSALSRSLYVLCLITELRSKYSMESKRAQITRKVKKTLDGLCRGGFAPSRDFNTRYHHWQMMSFTPGNCRRPKSVEGVGDGISS